MNRVFLAGYLASDPSSVPTSTGTMGTRISIAAKDARNSSETHFVNCVAWQQTAKFISTYLKKGDFLVVDARLTVNKYISKEGKNVSSLSVVIDSVRTTNTNKTRIQSTNDFSQFSKGIHNKNQFENYMEEEVANLEAAFPDTVDLDVSDAFVTKSVTDNLITTNLDNKPVAKKTSKIQDEENDDDLSWQDDLDD